MKVFISHKKEDNLYALNIKNALKSCQIDAYLDLLDEDISGDGEELTDHIKEQLRICTDVIVVLSEKTKDSWWVPFEIGMATEKDMPIANYLVEGIVLPDYLEFWPRLKNYNDVCKYVEVRKEIREHYGRPRYIFESNILHPGESETRAFYRKLKQELK